MSDCVVRIETKSMTFVCFTLRDSLRPKSYGTALVNITDSQCINNNTTSDCRLVRARAGAGERETVVNIADL